MFTDEQRLDRQNLSLAIFWSDVADDEKYLEALMKGLNPLQKQGLISLWCNRNIDPGTSRLHEIVRHLNNADCILLLISPDFVVFDKDDEVGREVIVKRALERHTSGETMVIPLILRPVIWQDEPYASLPMILPRNKKPVSGWSDQDEAMFDIVSDLSRIIKQRCNMPLEAEHIAPQVISSVFIAQNKADYQRLLNHLILHYRNMKEHFLQTLISLKLREQSKAISSRMPPILRHQNHIERVFPVEQIIKEAYDRADDGLLILGEPGGGKSTFLLQLALHILQSQRLEEPSRLPVIFHLSTWSEKHLPLAEWLAEELHLRYKESQRVSQLWLENRCIFPLLDGLDEVKPEDRSACIEAINFYQLDSSVPLVVCCRSSEYFAQPRRLMFEHALVVQPLEAGQVNDYLLKVHPDLEAALQQNPALLEVVTMPLMLNVLIVAYQDASDVLLLDGTVQPLQQQMFATYLKRGLLSYEREQKRLVLASYEREQKKPAQDMVKRLIWLARQMRSHNQTDFYLEQLQYDWLPEQWNRSLFLWLGNCLPGMVIGLLVTTMVTILILNGYTIWDQIELASSGGLVGGILAHGRSSVRSGRDDYGSPRRLHKVRNILPLSGVVGLVAIGCEWRKGLCLFWQQNPYLFGLLGVIIFGIAGCVFAFVTNLKRPTWMRLSSFAQDERYLLLIDAFYHAFCGALLTGFSIGILDSLGVGWCIALYCGPGVGIFTGVFDGLSFSLCCVLIGGLSGFLISILLRRVTNEVKPAEKVTFSWRETWRRLTDSTHLAFTLRIVFITFFIGGLSIGLGGGLSVGIPDLLNGGVSVEIQRGVLNGVSLGVGVGLSTGGIYWLLFGLFQSVTVKALPEKERTAPNQGIRSSASNGWLLGLLSGGMFAGVCIAGRLLSFAVGLKLGDRLNIELIPILLNGLFFGIAGGMLVALLSGWLACWQHWVLRTLLHFRAALPLRSIAFLDQATRYVFMYKVGGGFRFFHPLFQSYIASLDPTTVVDPPVSSGM